MYPLPRKMLRLAHRFTVCLHFSSNRSFSGFFSCVITENNDRPQTYGAIPKHNKKETISCTCGQLSSTIFPAWVAAPLRRTLPFLPPWYRSLSPATAVLTAQTGYEGYHSVSLASHMEAIGATGTRSGSLLPGFSQAILRPLKQPIRQLNLLTRFTIQA